MIISVICKKTNIKICPKTLILFFFTKKDFKVLINRIIKQKKLSQTETVRGVITYAPILTIILEI